MAATRFPSGDQAEDQMPLGSLAARVIAGSVEVVEML